MPQDQILGLDDPRPRFPLLATFGVQGSAAFAVTAAYRLITFYMAALEGFFGSHWLERNDYI